jgi:hypothetical protein
MGDWLSETGKYGPASIDDTPIEFARPGRTDRDNAAVRGRFLARILKFHKQRGCEEEQR